MTLRALPARTYNGLKTRTRKLIEKAGGAEEAAGRTRVRPSALYNYGNVNNPDHFMPVDVILDLEADTGEPIVSAYLAKITGHVLIPVVARVGDGELARDLARIGKETADLFARVASDMADGKVSREEAAATITEVDEAIQALSSFRARLSLIDQGGEG